MKKTVLVIFCTLTIVSMVQAQGRNRHDRNPVPKAPLETLTLTGNLSIAQGMIAIKSGDITYLIPNLMHYTGFINTLRDGAQVTLEGAVRPGREDTETKVILPSKLTIGGKEYDLKREKLK